jgi:hypothetical protein
MAIPKHGQGYKPTRDYTKERHVERLDGKPTPDPEDLPEWFDLQLHWLHTVPGYREEVKRRVSAARKQQMMRDNKILRSEWGDVDHLGREVEGCG